MKKIFTIVLITVFYLQLYSQQEAQYTQFMFNKVAFNPAYAGSHETLSFTGIYRTQWVNLEGAPVSQTFSFHTPIFGKRIGLGMNLHHDKIGPTNSWNYSLIYAYRIPIKEGHLSVGAQGIIRNYRVDWRDVTAIHSGDALYGNSEESKLVPNFGLGVYYSNKAFYAGLSIPRLLDRDLTFQYDGNIQNGDYSKEARHAFLMAGMLIPLNEQLSLKPAILIKYAQNAPTDVDLHAGLVFDNKLNIGVTYRVGGFHTSIGESLDFVFQVLLNEKLKLGLAYDYTFSEIRNYHAGSYELLLEYSLISKQKGTTNPRFF